MTTDQTDGAESSKPTQSFCTACRASLEPGDQFCGSCGTPVRATTSAARSVTESDEPYPSGAALGAFVCTLIAPFISIIAALVMRANETRPTRRAFLKMWAILSAVWIVFWFVIVIAIFSSASSGVDQPGDEFGGNIPTCAPADQTQVIPCMQATP